MSIRHAKSQGLEMQIDKHQGVCGRLMCCLVYEHSTYKTMRRGLPKVGKIIDTPAGEGRVREVNVPLRMVRVQVGRNDHKTFSAEELGLPPPDDTPEPTPMTPAQSTAAPPEQAEGEPPWRRPPKRRRRRRRGPPKPATG